MHLGFDVTVERNRARVHARSFETDSIDSTDLGSGSRFATRRRVVTPRGGADARGVGVADGARGRARDGVDAWIRERGERRCARAMREDDDDDDAREEEEEEEEEDAGDE